MRGNGGVILKKYEEEYIEMFGMMRKLKLIHGPFLFGEQCKNNKK